MDNVKDSETLPVLIEKASKHRIIAEAIMMEHTTHLKPIGCLGIWA